jgi:hypothetical protein
MTSPATERCFVSYTDEHRMPVDDERILRFFIGDLDVRSSAAVPLEDRSTAAA